MPKVALYNQNGSTAGDIELNASVFGIEPKTEDESLEVIRLKCGSLIALANVAGVLLATGEYNETVERYSYYKGIIAQISGDYYVLLSGNRSDIEKTNIH